MTTLYMVEEHDQVLDLWREQDARRLRVVHIDAHCDMRGLLIDRPVRRAYRIQDITERVDIGNYLAHAVLEGRVEAVHWVYNPQGGRRNDVGTIKYETDLTAWPHRRRIARSGDVGIALDFEEIPFARWAGLQAGETLDIDWDFFAGLNTPVDQIDGRVQAFLNSLPSPPAPAAPAIIYVCYSPDFSRPTRVQFEQFVSDIAERLEAHVVDVRSRPRRSVKENIYRKRIPPGLYRLARAAYYTVNLALRKWGIY